MDALVALAVLVIVAAVVWVVASPLRADRGATEEAAETAALEELEAEKAAKYREIRDAELDYRTGKLDEADWRVIDRGLRAEAVVILGKIDALGAGASESPSGR